MDRKNRTNPIRHLAAEAYPKNQSAPSENLEDLVNCDIETLQLTEGEKELALQKALHEKKQKVRQIQYVHKLRYKPEPKTYTKEEYFQRYLDLAKDKFGDDAHHLDPVSEKIIKTLCLYFANDDGFEDLGYSMRKGLCLIGPVGCYKTTIMRFFQLNQRMSYLVVSVRDIANRFADHGHKVIGDYSGHSELGYESQKLFHQRFGGYCFDDLGTEDEKKNFGNQTNVMQNILMNRYDNHQGIYTHMTTNLDADGIVSYYGERLASRMREMFNFIEFPHDTTDKRK